MSIYNNKHCVFEQVGVESDTIQWNHYNNLDSDNAVNDWNISNMRNMHLPAKLLKLSSDLQGVITNTTIQTATNGVNGTLVSTNDKLFLPAEKEMTASPTKARTEESSALTTWSYWTTHTQSSDRVKNDSTNTARIYWLRSALSNNTENVLYVNNLGNFVNYRSSSYYWVSICYAL